MILPNQYEITCDVYDCTNRAEYAFNIKGRLAKFYICKHCLDQLSEDYRKLTTPKAIKNAIKKAQDNNSTTISISAVSSVSDKGERNV